MRLANLGYTLGLSAAVAMLFGCGGSQPPIGAPRTMPQTRIATQAKHGGSWMLPEATSEDLLYVSKLKNVTIYAYPSDKVVGNLTGFDYASGLCSDLTGDVWVTDSRKSRISEYAHAGTKPIARLTDENEPVGCAVDPRSGDLAVANYADNISVYPHGSGNPAIYTAPDFYEMQFCSYDGSGNLFIDGNRGRRMLVVPGILKLSYGGTRLQRFKLEGRLRHGLHSAGALQWDGKSLVVGYAGKYDNVLYQISDLGSIGKITKKIKLTVPDGGSILGFFQFLLHKDEIIAPYTKYPQRYYIASWSYPKGGPAVKKFKVHGRFFPAGLTVSVAPK